ISHSTLSLLRSRQRTYRPKANCHRPQCERQVNDASGRGGVAMAGQMAAGGGADTVTAMTSWGITHPTSASTTGRPAGFRLPGGSRCGRSHSRAPEITSAATARAAAPTAAAFPDWRVSPNIHVSPDVYEIENQAIARAGHVRAALRALAPWDGRVLVDLGCGTGFWLPAYLSEPGRAHRVIGVEPDPVLLQRAAARVAGLEDVSVVAGSAEHIPLPDRSADVVHAMFAYFLSPGGDAGLAEVLRVLRPGGSLVVVDNDYRWGQFAGLLAAAATTPPSRKAAEIDAWWRD